jgi:hypothetical protein
MNKKEHENNSRTSCEVVQADIEQARTRETYTYERNMKEGKRNSTVSLVKENTVLPLGFANETEKRWLPPRFTDHAAD